MNIEQRIALAKVEIRDDITAGIVPASVSTFSELHDHVDADMYGMACDPAHGFNLEGDPDGSLARISAMQDELDSWLRSGRPAPPAEVGFDDEDLTAEDRKFLARND